MSPLPERLAQHISALVNGWTERIEYGSRITVHAQDCTRKLTCSCPDVIEKRAKTVRHQALIAQLQLASTTKNGGGTNGGNANKPESRPPGNMAPLELIDTITEEAAEHYYHLCGTPPASHLSVAQVLANLASVAMTAPRDAVHDTTIAARNWVRRARIMLGYDKPYAMLAETVCGTCGGALSVAVDASTDVRCVGTPATPPCGTVYPRHEWLDLLRGSTYVSTDVAVAALVRDGVKASSARQTLYRWAGEGRIRNHGSDSALWDLEEVRRGIER